MLMPSIDASSSAESRCSGSGCASPWLIALPLLNPALRVLEIQLYTLAQRPRNRHLLALRELVEVRLLLLGEPDGDELHRSASSGLVVRHQRLLRIAWRSYRARVGRSYRTRLISRIEGR